MKISNLIRSEAPAEAGTTWLDCSKLPVEGKGWTDTESFYDRLPARAKGKATDAVWGLSHNTAGFCYRFTTDAKTIRVRWTLTTEMASFGMAHMPATGVSGFDLYSRDRKGRWTFKFNGQPTQFTNTSREFEITPGCEHLLYLPLYNGIKSLEVGIPAGKKFSSLQFPAKIKPVVVYGTSITQGGCATRPGLAYTAILGRMLDMPVINLGFSGSGRGEIEMAEFMAELDPSIYVLDCLWNMTPELVAERIEPFVKKLRMAHQNVPIVLPEDCNHLGISPTEKGKVLRSVFKKLKADGIKQLHFMPNKGMLGDDTESTVDCVHPNDIGMMRLAEAFAKFLKPILRN